MYVMGKASKMSRGPGALISGKDHKEDYSQSEGWEVENTCMMWLDMMKIFFGKHHRNHEAKHQDKQVLSGG